MRLDQSSIKPIYIQIAEGIEDDILNGILQEGEQSYSQYQIARRFGINPATAAKGINMLAADEVLFKKRGMGMYVSEGAKKIIKSKRKDIFFNSILKEMVIEARKLGITRKEIKEMIDGMEGDENL